MKAMRILSATALLGGIAFLSPASGQPAPAQGPSVEAPPEEESVTTLLEYDEDRANRMTVPVNIDGSGPYRFVVDTGAERTVISSDLADRLNLVPGRTSTVHSMTEVSRIATVVIPQLEVAGRTVRDINAPALERGHLGAEGMLGVDSLQRQRISFDFGRQEMTITPAKKREERWPKDTIVVTARSVFGHLVLIDASVDGQKVWVIVDTGSQVTVANEALRRKLARKGKLGITHPVEMVSVTGGRTMVDRTKVSLIRIGGVDIVNMPIAFADVHPFKKLKLTKRPAILLGMDALQLFDRVSVDFANRRMKVLPHPRTALPEATEMARTAAVKPAG
ncbi:MAG TPA: retroviral-like aspartic protease family protein [Allosphingosinicella sp.]